MGRSKVPIFIGLRRSAESDAHIPYRWNARSRGRPLGPVVRTPSTTATRHRRGSSRTRRRSFRILLDYFARQLNRVPQQARWILRAIDGPLFGLTYLERYRVIQRYTVFALLWSFNLCPQYWHSYPVLVLRMSISSVSPVPQDSHSYVYGPTYPLSS